MTDTTSSTLGVTREAQDSPGGDAVVVSRQVYVSLKEMWEIYIKAVKSADKSADNAKVCEICGSTVKPVSSDHPFR